MKQREHGGIFFRLLFLLLFLGLLACVYMLRNPLMRLAGQLWMVNDPPAKADALIVLGDDNYAGERATQAAKLYEMGLSPIVVASGRELRPYAGISELIGRDLESHGVPAASILKFSHRGENTRGEAEALAGLINSRGWKRVLVVTSNYHTRRALFIFERVLPANVTVHVSGAYDSEFDPSRWWETRQGVKLFSSELLGYVVAWWELRGELRGRVPGPGGTALLIGNARGITGQVCPVFCGLGGSPVTDWKHIRFTCLSALY